MKQIQLMVLIVPFFFNCCKKNVENTDFAYKMGTKRPNVDMQQYQHNQNELIITKDNNLIVYYDSYDTIAHKYVTCLRKLDFNGNLLWEKTYKFNSYSHAVGVMQTNDEGYLLIGEYNYKDDWVFTYTSLIRTNSNGDSLWSKNYLDGYIDSGIKSIQKDNGSFLLFTYTDLYKNLLLNINSVGDTLSTKYIERENCYPSCSGYYDFQIDNNENYYFVGEYLAKYDNNFKLIWSKKNNFRGESIILDNDNNSLVFGYTYESNHSDYCLYKYDNSGNILWNKTYDYGKTEFAEHIEKTDDGGFVLLGTSEDNSGVNTIKLIKVDNEGNTLWVKNCNLHSSDSNIGISVKQVAKNQYIIFGLCDYKPFLTKITI